MFSGRLLAICIASDRCATLHTVEQAEALAGQGLAGDRYARQQGTYSKGGASPDREVTLIEIEAIEAIQRECAIELAPAASRRNLVTRGVPLNHLIGQEFTIGDVVLRGIRLCEPCGHLEKLTELKGVKDALVHRGGLRAQVVRSGMLRVGDIIQAHGERGA
jgi:MOSC domain-containing protein YiiM